MTIRKQKRKTENENYTFFYRQTRTIHTKEPVIPLASSPNASESIACACTWKELRVK